MPYLLDTNVLSELRKGTKCNRLVRRWAASTIEDRHCISVLSLGEIRKGIEILRRKSPSQCAAFEHWLARLKEDYAEDILSITEDVVNCWGHLMAVRTQPVIDSLIAATALEFRLTIATRNVGDFELLSVDFVNPFE